MEGEINSLFHHEVKCNISFSMTMTRKPEPQERRNDRKAKTAGKKECSES
jgi:hypothetical protein